MSKPFFQVGEEVILQSRQNPELNGECTVRQIVFGTDLYNCRVSGRIIYRDCDATYFGYILEEVISEAISDDGAIIENIWDESAIKKKHKPSDNSFK